MRGPRFSLGFLLLAGLLAFGCSDEPATDAPAGPGEEVPPGEVPDPTAPPSNEEPPLAWLELHPLDIWGQLLAVAGSELSIVTASGTRAEPLAEKVTLGLYRNGAFTVRLASAEHHPSELSVAFDGATLTMSTPTADPQQAPGLLVGHEVRLVEDPAKIGSAPSAAGRPIPVNTAYIGLRHRWFASSGRPARHGNAIELLMDGEEAWGRVHQAITAARNDIKLSTWWWESDFELVRSDDLGRTEAQRYNDTILGMLEQSQAKKRIAVGQFWGQDGILSWLTTDSAVRVHAEAANDGFELMGQANVTEGSFQLVPEKFSFGARVRGRFTPNPGQTFDNETDLASSMPPKAVDLRPLGVSVQAASYHQKFMTIDEDLAFVGGMNFQAVDWDDHEHRVFNPKRMGFEATQSERQEVADKAELPETGPRKDYMLRIEGPSAQDVNDVFHERWEYLLASGVEYSAQSTPFTVARSAAERPNGVQVQITTTMPAPFEERSIGESWFNAVRAAESYIFIEDQYFRVPMLAEAIVLRMREKPELRLFVITRPVTTGTDAGCGPTARADLTFRSQFPDRYTLAQLRAFDTSIASFGIDETDAHFVNVDVHSKMLIVDDIFMSVGSANKNNRGILYEAEMNAVVVDRAWVTAARRRILANVLPPAVAPEDQAPRWYEQLKTAAIYNDTVLARWESAGMDLDLNGAPVPEPFLPRGLVYSLVTPPESACTIGPVGDDMVSAPPQATPGR